MTSPTVSAERATTLLDTLAVLAVGAGVGGGAWQWIGWWGLVPAGLVVLVMSAVAAGIQSGRVASKPPPAPRDPGLRPIGSPDTVHVR